MAITPSTISILDANRINRQVTFDLLPSGYYTPHHVIESNGAVNGAANPLYATEALRTYGSVVGDGLTLNLANTAQRAFTSLAPGSAPVDVVIINPFLASEQGLTIAETIWVDPTGATAVESAGGTSIPLEPGQSITFPRTIQAVSWIAATAGHKIVAYQRA